MSPDEKLELFFSVVFLLADNPFFRDTPSAKATEAAKAIVDDYLDSDLSSGIEEFALSWWDANMKDYHG